MSGSPRRLPYIKDLKLRREEEKKERDSTGLVYIQETRYVGHFLKQAWEDSGVWEVKVK
jgi:hypothetical protein